jgi:uncharacterized protein (DUF433 family)
MQISAKTYVFETEHGGLRVTGARVSLDSVVHAYLQGYSPESIQEQYPALSVEQVYGAIAFYLANRAEVDEYLKRQEQLWEELRLEQERNPSPLVQRLRALRASGVDKQP